jgi:hypothetical protein
VTNENELVPLEALQNNLDRQLHWVKASEDRFRFSLPIALAMVASCAALLPQPPALSSLDFWFLIPAITLLMSYFGVALFTLLPEIRTGGSSLIYFGDISDGEQTKTVAGISNMSASDARKDISLQIFVNATIARRKYELSRIALILLFVATPFWTVSIYLSSPFTDRADVTNVSSQ